jgi:hypothetical protein
MPADATGAYAGDGILGAETRMWTRAGDLLAAAHSQMTYQNLSEPKVTKGLQQSWFEPQED